MVILGIDPGMSLTGYGAVRVINGAFGLVESGYIRTTSTLKSPLRLGLLYDQLKEVIERTHPNLICVENAFSVIRYPKAGIMLGEVLGVVYLLVFQRKIEHMEITPREIKNAIAGYGNAKKEQLRKAVMRILGLEKIESLHASDAIAAAIAAFYRMNKGKVV